MTGPTIHMRSSQLTESSLQCYRFVTLHFYTCRLPILAACLYLLLGLNRDSEMGGIMLKTI